MIVTIVQVQVHKVLEMHFITSLSCCWSIVTMKTNDGEG